MGWLWTGAQLQCPLEEPPPMSLFYTFHFIFLFSYPSLPFCVCVCVHMYVCVPLSLLSLSLAAYQIYEVPVCRSTSPPLPVSHFRPSYFTHVATCNLRTSSPGSSSLPLQPAQCSREHLHYTCLSLIKKSGPLCTANPSRQIDRAAPDTVGGM